MTRRRLLKISLFSGLLLSGAGLLGRWVAGGYDVPATVMARLRALSPKEYLVLFAVARRVLDGASPAVADRPGEPGRLDVALWVDGYLVRLPEGMRQDVRALLQLLEHAAISHSGRFSSLPAQAQDEILHGWEKSALALRRQGFQALKSICCLAFYQDERSFGGIGYSGPMVPASRG
jgi:hypothetical protein